MAQQNTSQPRSLPSAPINAKILYSGVLMKKGEYHKAWKERWFVLFDNRQCSYYHNREEFQDSKRPISNIDLKVVTAIQPVNKNKYLQQQQPKAKKKSIFSRASTDRSRNNNIPNTNIPRSQSFHSNGSYSNGNNGKQIRRYTEDIEDSYSIQSQSSMPEMSPVTPTSNSLRLSFKSLMGKKSKNNNRPRLAVEMNIHTQMSNGPSHSHSTDDNDEYSRGDSFHSVDSGNGGHNIFQAEFPFEIVTPNRTYLLCCLDAYSFNDWLEHLRNVTFGKKIYGGWLTKQGSKNKSWKKRWFVIFDTREIRYYETEKTKQEKGSIILDDLQIMNLLGDKQAKKVYKKKNVFELVCGGRKWVLIANSKEERELWFNRVVQVVPNVQRLDPLYSNELSYKRNDRAKKWMKGYFAMDVEYLFFFKNKASFDTFKSSAYFQEDLYTLALAQHVQGLIPLRNRKIKELDRNHPACSGKNKFVFSLKTSAGEFFLSTQYSIQMDDWLDAFRELYRLEVQEKRQGVISKRRKHSNSFGRRPPSPPSRTGSTSFGRRPPSPHSRNGSRGGHRSISPSPSNTAHHYNAAKVDDSKKKLNRKRAKGNRGIAEAGNIKNNQRSRPVPPSTNNTGHYKFPANTSQFAATNALKTDETMNGSHKHKRKPQSRRGRGGHNVNKPSTNEDDSPPPPTDEFLEDRPSSPPPPARPPEQIHRRTNTPFKDVDDMIRERRKSKEKIFGDDAHYEMATKNAPQRKSLVKSGDFEALATMALKEGNEGSSGDSDTETKKKEKKKGSKRSKRKDKKRKPSVGQVLKAKIGLMTSGKKRKKKEAKEAKKRKKSRERKEKEQKKKEAKEAKQLKKQKKKGKGKEKGKKQTQTVGLKNAKLDPMKSLDQNKKALKKQKKKKEAKVRRRSVGDVLKGALSGGSKKKEIEPKVETAKKGNTNTLKPSSNGRKKRSQKVRRRSTGEALRDRNSDSEEEDTKVSEGKVATKSNTLRTPVASGRKKRKDKTRRRSVNDVIKGVIGSKKKEEKTEEKEKEKTKKKKKGKGPRRVSLGDALRWGNKKKDETEGFDQGNKPSNKPPRINTATSNSNSSSGSDDRKKRRRNREPGASKKSKQNNDTSDELAVYKNKINARTRKKNARHLRKETPQYDISTKDLLKQESEAAYSEDSDDMDFANEILSEENENYPRTPDMDSPKAPPKGYIPYRKQKVEITDKKGATPKKASTRGFRKRGDKSPSTSKDTPTQKKDSKNNKGFAIKQIGKNKPKTPQSKKRRSRSRSKKRDRNKRNGWRKDDASESESEESDSSDYDSDESESEYETGDTDSEYTNSDSEYSDSDSEYTDDSDSEYTDDSDRTSGSTQSGDASSSDLSSDSEKGKGGKRDSYAKYADIIKDFKKQAKAQKNKGRRTSDKDYDAAYDWEDKKLTIVKDKKKGKKEKSKDKERKKEEESLKKQEQDRKKKEEQDKKRKAEEEQKRQSAKQRQLELETERKRKAEEHEQKERERKRKEAEAKQEEDTESESEDSSEEDYEDESEEDSSDEDNEPSEEDDSLESNSDGEQEEIDDSMRAYVKLNEDTTAILPEGDEHKEWERLEAAKRLQMKHRRRSTELWKHTMQDIIADENDDPTAEKEELDKIWMKLKSIPKSSRRDTTETRIVKEFMMFQLNHDHSIYDHYIIIERMQYPNIYQWNGMFIGPSGTPYVNGKYRIVVKFAKDYPAKPPKITFLTKIYNSSVKHNKRKKRGLLKLPKFFDRIWSKKISLRQWLNVVYEFLFYYCGDHFFDPMNQRVAREFIFAFDSFIDTCYQWNMIFANGFEQRCNMLELYDEYGERQKLTFHCAPFSHQFDVSEYRYVKEVIWQSVRKKYKCSYECFIVLLDYFGNEFYYTCLSELIREPHICVKHKVKQYSNIVKW